MDGGAGNDRVYGQDGSDAVTGGDGDDVIYGDNANDGNDNEGYADFFVFDNDDGNDKVFDFEEGIDRVYLSDGATLDDVSFTVTGSGNTIMTYGLTTVTFYDSIVTAADVLTTTDYENVEDLPFGEMPEVLMI